MIRDGHLPSPPSRRPRAWNLARARLFLAQLLHMCFVSTKIFSVITAMDFTPQQVCTTENSQNTRQTGKVHPHTTSMGFMFAGRYLIQLLDVSEDASPWPKMLARPLSFLPLFLADGFSSSEDHHRSNMYRAFLLYVATSSKLYQVLFCPYRHHS